MEDFAEGMLIQVYPGKFGERKVGPGRDDASLAVRWITYVIRIIPSWKLGYEHFLLWV